MRCAGVVQSGQPETAWVARPNTVTCAVVSSISHVSRRSVVTWDSKRARTLCVVLQNADCESWLGSAAQVDYSPRRHWQVHLAYVSAIPDGGLMPLAQDLRQEQGQFALPLPHGFMYKMRSPSAGLCVCAGAVRFDADDQLVRAPHRLKGPCVDPPAAQDVVLQLAAHDIRVVDVGHFELTTRRGPEAVDDVEDCLVIHEDAGHGQVRAWLRRLLLDAYHTLALQLDDAEAVRVRYGLE